MDTNRSYLDVKEELFMFIDTMQSHAEFHPDPEIKGVHLLKYNSTHSSVSKLPLSGGIIFQIDKSIFFTNNCSLFLRMCIFCCTFAL